VAGRSYRRKIVVKAAAVGGLWLDFHFDGLAFVIAASRAIHGTAKPNQVTGKETALAQGVRYARAVNWERQYCHLIIFDTAALLAFAQGSYSSGQVLPICIAMWGTLLARLVSHWPGLKRGRREIGSLLSIRIQSLFSTWTYIWRMKTIRRFLADEAGATAIEYGLIAAGIALAIIAVVNGLGAKLNTKFTSINTSLK
jgi:pilus assembly protein Flp/PilA